MAPLFESSFLEGLFSSINQISDAPPPKPFPPLVSSFSTPTTSEVIVIKDAIANSSSHQHSMEKLLSRLKDIEKALQVRLNAERDYKAHLRGMLSIIRMFPPEVLSNIFLMCSPDPPNEITKYSSALLNRSIPWSISRVCRKWRYVCLTTPRLWVDIPTILYDYQYGFFELLRIATKLSFPHDIELRIWHTNAKGIEQLEEILPRVHSLDVRVDLPMIKGLVQMKESFKRLKSATIHFTLNCSDEPPTLDFLTPVTSLNVSCSNPLAGWERNPYMFLRSVYFHWPNLTTFHGEQLPATFLHRILFAAPLLQEVTMHNPKDTTSFDSSTASLAPTSKVCHADLKYLSLNCGRKSSLPDDILKHLHLPGLKNLHVEHAPQSFLSFLRETHGSLVELSLGEPLGTLDDRREMYTLCPALKTFTLDYAVPEDIGILAVSPQSKLCPTLRHLTLHKFVLPDADSARVFEDICSSRGLAPFSAPNSPEGLFQLDRITAYMDDPDTVCLFRQRCLLGDNDNLVLPWFLLLDPTSLSYETLKEKLKDLNRTISTSTPYFLIMLEDDGIIEEVKKVADGEGNHRGDIRDDARTAYEQWAIRVQEIRGKPRWKTTLGTELGPESGYFLERE